VPSADGAPAPAMPNRIRTAICILGRSRCQTIAKG
jgi:hypothetical protein